MNLDWLHRHRIAYKSYPINDKPTRSYYWGWYYEEGTTERFVLFGGKFKIKSIKSFYWHVSVIWWLNSGDRNKHEQMGLKELIDVSKVISNPTNGFTLISIGENKAVDIAKSVYKKNQKPHNKSRKVVFKDGINLSFKEKMQIIGALSGNSKSKGNDLISAAKKILDNGEKVTNKSLSLVMNCSTKTIQRALTPELKKLIKDLSDEKLLKK